jgi:hypothetical protein
MLDVFYPIRKQEAIIIDYVLVYAYVQSLICSIESIVRIDIDIYVFAIPAEYGM